MVGIDPSVTPFGNGCLEAPDFGIFFGKESSCDFRIEAWAGGLVLVDELAPFVECGIVHADNIAKVGTCANLSLRPCPSNVLIC